MFDEKIKELKATIVSITASIAQKTADVKAALNADDLEKARSIKGEIEISKDELKNAKADLEMFEEALNAGGAEGKAGQKVQAEELTYRDKVNAFLQSKGAVAHEGLRFGETRDEVLIPLNDIVPKTDGVLKTNTKPVTSEELVTTPLREVKTVVDLKQFTTIHKTNKGSGKYPILKKATSRMHSVAELEKNPALAKPEFENIQWEVQTYRGAIPISQESIDDADVDILALVSEQIGEIKVNTTNYAIAEVLKTFEAKTVANLDELKAILNVSLDPAYQVSFEASQSFYNILDTLKDKNGRYLLQDSIVSPTGKVALGKTINVLADEALGNATEAKAFVGDSARGVLFVDRLEIGLRWAENDIYGQYLQAVMRFDVKKADAKAGYFVTFTPAP
ncbi:phage major capsid protein [Streptococcus anginosus]|uniref:phage major capsid protein n=1 Tax=Streptococcus anginosus TaxID=1328 RepID=UPI002001A419|nr:phage major capsid protein [Streptococcus anginosus]